MNMQPPLAYMESKNNGAKATFGWIGILSVPESKACYKHVNNLTNEDTFAQTQPLQGSHNSAVPITFSWRKKITLKAIDKSSS